MFLSSVRLGSYVLFSVRSLWDRAESSKQGSHGFVGWIPLDFLHYNECFPAGELKISVSVSKWQSQRRTNLLWPHLPSGDNYRSEAIDVLHLTTLFLEFVTLAILFALFALCVSGVFRFWSLSAMSCTD